MDNCPKSVKLLAEFDELFQQLREEAERRQIQSQTKLGEKVGFKVSTAMCSPMENGKTSHKLAEMAGIAPTTMEQVNAGRTLDKLAEMAKVGHGTMGQVLWGDCYSGHKAFAGVEAQKLYEAAAKKNQLEFLRQGNNSPVLSNPAKRDQSPIHSREKAAEKMGSSRDSVWSNGYHIEVTMAALQ